MERDVWKLVSEASLGSEGNWREQQRMKERCHLEVAFSVGQEHKCQVLPPSTLSTFSSFNSPHLPLNLLLLLPLHLLLPFSICLPLPCLYPSPQSSASGNFAFRDERRPRNTWRGSLLSYHGITGQQEWRQDQDAYVRLCVHGCVRLWASACVLECIYTSG